MTTTSFDKINFAVRFSSPTEKDRAVGFNQIYSSIIGAKHLESVFTDTQRTQVVDNVTDIVRDIIFKRVLIPFADETDDPTTTIPPLFNNLPLSCCYGSSQIFRLTKGALEESLESCASGKGRSIEIVITLVSIHFDPSSTPTYRDWSEFSAPSSNGPSPNKTTTPRENSPDQPLEQPPTPPSSLSKIPPSIPHNFAIPPGNFLAATQLDYEVAASPSSFHKAPDLDTLADDDPVAKCSTIPFTTPPPDCSIPPKNTKLRLHKDVTFSNNTNYSFPPRFPACIHPDADPAFDTTASPLVTRHAPDISTLADDDPTFLNQGSVSSYDDPLSIAPEISSLADDNPYQRRICAYDDPFSNAPPIEFLADDDPTYLTHLSYMLCLLPSFVIPLASGEGVVRETEHHQYSLDYLHALALFG